jgi:hypothetical protein
MTFKDTLYGRDDEMDEFGDTGSAAYGDSLEEDYEQEEEEEEAEMPGMTEPGSQPATPGVPAPQRGGGGGGSKPAGKKPAAKPAKKKAAKKAPK